MSQHFYTVAMSLFIENNNMAAVARSLQSLYTADQNCYYKELKRYKAAGVGQVADSSVVSALQRQGPVVAMEEVLRRFCKGPSVTVLWAVFDYFYQSQIAPAWAASQQRRIH